jgi:hypothetical protein
MISRVWGNTFQKSCPNGGTYGNNSANNIIHIGTIKSEFGNKRPKIGAKAYSILYYIC